MTFGDFKNKIAQYVKTAQVNPPIRFINDMERGKYVAVFKDGMRMSAHPSGLKITVVFGDHHQMMFSA